MKRDQSDVVSEMLEPSPPLAAGCMRKIREKEEAESVIVIGDSVETHEAWRGTETRFGKNIYAGPRPTRTSGGGNLRSQNSEGS